MLDTPMNSSTGPSNIRPIIEAELKGCLHYANEGYMKNVFRGKVASDRKIREFLASCNLYDSRGKRWTPIPKKPTNETQLCSAAKRVVNAILVFFALSPSRTVMDTYTRGIPHVEGQDDSNGLHKLKTSPYLMVLALEGSNFPPVGPSAGKAALNSASSEVVTGPAKQAGILTEVQYPLCASPIEIVRQVARNQKEDLVQVAVYVRQCFIQQHNRKFVHALIITEMYLTLYHFDRSGVIQSTRVDIHREAADFVRVILGVCSLDPAVLGFDTSIYYQDSQRHIKTVDGNNKAVVHTLATTTPLFSRKAIRGRGTVCWTVVKKNGTPLLVKDAWRSKGRDPEYKLLKLAVGLQGVGQMVAYELKELNISTMRGVEAILGDDHFMDRIFTRITMEAYGEPIDHFKTRKQFLYAFHDAVSGHCNLWNQSILHRDVSVNNILLGRKDATEGNRGILIDLDRAITLDCPTSVDFQTGTRAFQSYLVLTSGLNKTNPAHDYADDLESFFYVYCWIVLGFAGPGQLVDPRPTFLQKWESDDPEAAAGSKSSFLLIGLTGKVTPFFGQPCRELLVAMRGFLKAKVFSKSDKIEADIWTTNLLDLKDEAAADYETFLGFIKTAIDKVDAEDVAGSLVLPLPGPPNGGSNSLAVQAPTARPRNLRTRPRLQPPAQRPMVTRPRRTAKLQDVSG